MFLELPKDIQEKIYDMMHIKDRVNLNKALPTTDKITRTIKTNQQKDNKLRMTYYFFKKRKNKISIKNKIYHFIIKNIEDPTCQDIMNELFPPSNLSIQNTVELNPIFYKIEQELMNNIISEELFNKLPENVTYDNVSFLKDIIIKTNDFTVDSFKKMLAYPSALKVLKLIFSDNNIIFTIINYEKDAILELVLEYQDILGIKQSQINYVKRFEIATLFERKICIEIMIKHLQISYEIQQAWLECAIQNCNVELATWLMNDIGVLL